MPRKGVYVFGDGQKPYNSITTGFNKAIKRANQEILKDNEKIQKENREHPGLKLIPQPLIENLTFHSTRHTFATRLVERGIDLVTVKELLGHYSIEMTMRYAHPSPTHIVHAIESLVTDKDWTKNGQNEIEICGV